METKAYVGSVDRTGWPAGPWDDEPDKVQWPDPDTGLPCLAVRNEGGHWCGYVGLPPGHPLHGKGYDDVDADVHGGLTFADECADAMREDRYVCHVPGPGEPDHVWWLGFDCAHSGDYSPWKAKRAETEPIFAACYETYRTIDYVRRQCASLAKQLASKQ